MLFRLLTAAVVTVFCCASLAASETDSDPPAVIAEPAIVAVERDRHQRMTVPVTVNGTGPFRFLVDTGAQATVVTSRITSALGLKPSGRVTLVAMASSTSVQTIRIADLGFAGRRFSNLVAPLLDSGDIGADGILGLDSLQDLRVVIDLRADAISVIDAPSRAERGYEIVVRAQRKLGRMIITNARIAGARTAIIIDTGSWHSIGNRALQKRLRAGHIAVASATDVTGTLLHSEVAVLPELRIGEIGMNNVPVGFTDSPAFAALGLHDRPAIILGMSSLRLFDRVAIDFARRKVLFDIPSGIGRDRLHELFDG